MQKLDKSQQAFCEAGPGNLRLLAPAGCGKTLCILYRCVHLAENGKSEHPRFLIVTFTVAAKQEILSRLNEDKDFARLRDNVEVTTLNSWGYRRIRNATFSPKLIVGKKDFHFTMLNQLQPIWRTHKQVAAAIEKNKNNAPRKLMEVIDAYKSLGFDHTVHTNYEKFSQRVEELREQGLGWKFDAQSNDLVKLEVLPNPEGGKSKQVKKSDNQIIYDAFFKFWKDATGHLIDSATFTMEDQKYYAYLDEREKIAEKKFLSGAARYDHVFVDEFQDINPLDLALVKAITERSRASLTIVGDDDQAIFEWRGATPEYILNPTKFFGGKFQTHTLEVNYRSPPNIVEHSQQLIAHNKRRVDKRIKSARKDKATITITKVEDISMALDFVHKEVARSIQGGESPSRVAIIGRKRSQIIPYQVFFASKDIPFCAAEDLQVFMSEAFERLMGLIMIKGQASARRMKTQVVDDVLKLCNLVKRYPLKKVEYESLRRHLQQSNSINITAALGALRTFRGSLKGANDEGQRSANMAEAIESFISAESVADSLMVLGDGFDGLRMDIGKAEDDIFYADPPFAQLADYASRYGDDYEQFLDDIARAKDQLAYIPPFEEDGKTTSPDELWKRPLHLMTALRAKGKEFDSVILLDVNDGIWPNRNAKTPSELEAERRVFYVAFTRARKRIMMLVSERFGAKPAIPSQYIEELGFSID